MAPPSPGALLRSTMQSLSWSEPPLVMAPPPCSLATLPDSVAPLMVTAHSLLKMAPPVSAEFCEREPPLTSTLPSFRKMPPPRWPPPL